MASSMSFLPPIPELVVVVVTGGVAQIAAGMLVMAVCSKVAPQVQRDMKTSTVYRPMDSPGMKYVIFGAPFVKSFLVLLVLGVLRVPLQGGPVALPVATVMLWVIAAGHGILIDYSCMHVTKAATMYLEVSTGLSALANGFAMAWALKNLA
mmetsp:Transcript_19991/g.58401  ORF Transcript_19991/g.58401 Transcript_19991/m.58401 type:complete len:151 (-) Transcript_19991:85-537(-)